MSDDFRPKIGQSFNDMIEAATKARKKAAEAARNRPDMVVIPLFLDKCPICEFKELEKSVADDKGLTTVTCGICNHQWQEDQMYRLMVKETTIS